MIQVGPWRTRAPAVAPVAAVSRTGERAHAARTGNATACGNAGNHSSRPWKELRRRGTSVLAFPWTLRRPAVRIGSVPSVPRKDGGPGLHPQAEGGSTA